MTAAPKKIITSPHIHTAMTVDVIMRQVLYALLPAILVSTFYFGIGILIQCILAISVALLSETFVLKLRKQEIRPTLKNGTAIITALLFALTLSPYTLCWINSIGIVFAIVIAKHLFGGLGKNPFNPAMAGYAFILLCFPSKMVYWADWVNSDVQLSLSQYLTIIFSGSSEIKTNSLYGTLSGKGWIWVSVAYLGGGLWLLINKVIRWQIPLTVLATILIVSLIFNFIDTDSYPSALFHLFSGGTLLCAFFIATDPVSSATTPKGKIIYAAGIGLLIYVIRSRGNYADGIAFAVLIMNALAPLIDYYTKPKVFGRK